MHGVQLRRGVKAHQQGPHAKGAAAGGCACLHKWQAEDGAALKIVAGQPLPAEEDMGADEDRGSAAANRHSCAAEKTAATAGCQLTEPLV
jgi:hypothetical protein